jgi:hypothetical protein
MILKQPLPVFALSTCLLNGSYALAELTLPAFSYNIQGKSLQASMNKNPNEAGSATAKLGSGLALSLNNSLFSVSMDYSLAGTLRDTNELLNDPVDSSYLSHNVLQTEIAVIDGNLDQKLNSSIKSQYLNNLFNINAAINSNTLLLNDGDHYQFSVAPSIKKSIADFALLDLKYNLDRRSQEANEHQSQSYSVALSGNSDNQRLSWKGGYSSSVVSWENILLEDSSEKININTRFKVSSDLQIDLSGVLKNSAQYRGDQITNRYESHYSTSILWDPMADYQLAIKFNQLSETVSKQDESFGSGSFTWWPLNHWKVSLNYGDRMFQGKRGWKLSTLLDLDKLL